MSLVEDLYAQSDTSHNQRAWNMFPLLSPNFSFLRMESTIDALKNRDTTYPLDAFRFAVFPDEARPSDHIRKCINRGVSAINSLTKTHLEDYLDDTVRKLLLLPVASPWLDLFDVVSQARQYWERGTIGVRRTVSEPREQAYSLLRAIELGYRVGTIDISPDVQNSLIYVDQAITRIEHLLSADNPRQFDGNWPGGPSVKFDTEAGVAVYSTEDKPIRSRLKYVSEGKRKYTSLLMKIYGDLEYPNTIRDYIGGEIIVDDDDARGHLVDYIRRKTRLGGAFEGFKDTTRQGLNRSSSDKFGVNKFFLRVPVRLHQPIEHDATGRITHESVPVEIQVLTLDDARNRDLIPEVTHHEYKRRQFMRVFPILFPREIYEPELRRLGR